METNNLEYANEYSYDFLGISPENKISLFDIISKASSIFFESYIRPTLLSNGQCSEIQITLLNQEGKKISAVANITLKQSTLYWAIYLAEERDKLYQELLLARESLERQNDELLVLTRIDPLTSLLNRRAAINDFEKLTSQLKRSFIPMSFLIIDIDFFKVINDNYGHDEGDRILIELSNTLKKCSRDSDILARWGGEEFLLVLYNSGISDTEIFCERLHQKIKIIQLPSKKSLTVSIGVTELKHNETAEYKLLDRVLKRADKALYLAKNNGRNRTEVYK
jgi:diguanylate cyclase (GGDEF)-like protein